MILGEISYMHLLGTWHYRTIFELVVSLEKLACCGMVMRPRSSSRSVEGVLTNVEWNKRQSANN
jgi:hypothetical protein